MSAIPEAYRDLFERETYASFATVMPDGTPQVTPVWIDYDGGHLLVNTARGRRKERNVRENPKVGLRVLDPYRYLSIRGEVEGVTEEGAVETSTSSPGGTSASRSTRTSDRNRGRVSSFASVPTG